MSREGALWIGGLETYMDEDFLKQALFMMGEANVASIKVIKNKFTGEPANYGKGPSGTTVESRLNGHVFHFRLHQLHIRSRGIDGHAQTQRQNHPQFDAGEYFVQLK